MAHVLSGRFDRVTTTLLEIVSEARELRDAAEREWRNAIVRARAGRHTLEEIGRAAGLKKAGVAYVLKREKENER